MNHRDLVTAQLLSKLYNTTTNYAIAFDQRKMNVSNVTARIEEDHAADLEKLR